MSFESLLDTRIRVWRNVFQEGALGAREAAFIVVHEPGISPNAFLVRPVSSVENMGPGEAPVGRRRLIGIAEMDLLADDVIEVVSGPDVGVLVQADGVPTRPRGHHVEVDCRLYNGTLPENRPVEES